MSVIVRALTYPRGQGRDSSVGKGLAIQGHAWNACAHAQHRLHQQTLLGLAWLNQPTVIAAEF